MVDVWTMIFWNLIPNSSKDLIKGSGFPTLSISSKDATPLIDPKAGAVEGLEGLETPGLEGPATPSKPRTSLRSRCQVQGAWVEEECFGWMEGVKETNLVFNTLKMLKVEKIHQNLQKTHFYQRRFLKTGKDTKAVAKNGKMHKTKTMWGPEELLNEWLKMNVQRLRRGRSSKKVRKSELFWKTFFFSTFYMFCSLKLYANERKCASMRPKLPKLPKCFRSSKGECNPLFFGGGVMQIFNDFWMFSKDLQTSNHFLQKLKKHVPLLLHASCWGLTRPQDAIIPSMRISKNCRMP